MGRPDAIADPLGAERLRLACERDRLRQVVDALTELASLGLPGDLLLERVVERVREVTGARGAVVELLDGDELEYVAATGSIAPARGLRLARATSLSGLCVAHRSLQVSEDTETDRRVDREACRRVGARSMMIAPLLYRDEAVGVIKIVSGEPQAFDTLDEYTLRLCAGLVSGIIARHLVNEESRRLLVERSFALRRAMTVLDVSPAAMVVHDLDGRIELWNPAAERLLGWPANEVIGRAAPFLADDQRAAFADGNRRIASDRVPRTVVQPCTRRDGSLLDLQVRATPLEDEGGRVAGIVRSFEPAEVRSMRRPASGAPDERLQRLTDICADAYVSIDADGRVTAWNPAAETLFGRPAGQARGRLLAELIIPPPLRDAHHQGLAHHVASRRSGVVGSRMRLPALHADGSTFDVEMSLSSAWIDGRPVFDALLRRAGPAQPDTGA